MNKIITHYRLNLLANFIKLIIPLSKHFNYRSSSVRIKSNVIIQVNVMEKMISIWLHCYWQWHDVKTALIMKNFSDHKSYVILNKQIYIIEISLTINFKKLSPYATGYGILVIWQDGCTRETHLSMWSSIVHLYVLCYDR